MVTIYELEHQYYDDGDNDNQFDGIPVSEFITAAQTIAGLTPHEHLAKDTLDASLIVPNEPAATSEQRAAAGHLVESLYHRLRAERGEPDPQAVVETVMNAYRGDQEAAHQQRERYPEQADRSYTLAHVRAAAQKRQTWLDGVLVERVDDDFANATSIRAEIERQRQGYYLIENAFGQAMQQEQLAELVALMEQVRAENPLLYYLGIILGNLINGAFRHLERTWPEMVPVMDNVFDTVLMRASGGTISTKMPVPGSFPNGTMRNDPGPARHNL